MSSEKSRLSSKVSSSTPCHTLYRGSASPMFTDCRVPDSFFSSCSTSRFRKPTLCRALDGCFAAIKSLSAALAFARSFTHATGYIEPMTSALVFSSGSFHGSGLHRVQVSRGSDALSPNTDFVYNCFTKVRFKAEGPASASRRSTYMRRTVHCFTTAARLPADLHSHPI